MEPAKSRVIVRGESPPNLRSQGWLQRELNGNKHVSRHYISGFAAGINHVGPELFSFTRRVKGFAVGHNVNEVFREHRYEGGQ